MRSLIFPLLLLAASLIAAPTYAQDTSADVVLLMVFSITPTPTTEVPDPPTIQSSIEFAWPSKYGGIDECTAFINGATWWHASGDASGLGRCIEGAPAGG